MEVIEGLAEMQTKANQLIKDGMTIGLVPTMGYLHEGHLSLMQAAHRDCRAVVVSIFVNPTQFGPNEDLERYPRDTDGDLKKCEKEGVSIVFLPHAKDIYPAGFCTYVRVEELGSKLCGISRPTHFQGVTTVVLKLFHLVKPHRAYFGEKDYQQLTIIRRMADDLNLDIEIVGMPTIREAGELAMSSRNAYLSSEERDSALSLSRALKRARELVHQGEYSSGVLQKDIRRIIEGEQSTQIDYVAICHPQTLEDLETIKDRALVALAVKIGTTRLIDNCVVFAKTGRKVSWKE